MWGNEIERSKGTGTSKKKLSGEEKKNAQPNWK